MSAGAEALFLPGLSGFGGLAFGNITLGDDRGHATLNFAVPFFGESGFTPDLLTLTLNGYSQFDDGFGLVTEDVVTFSTNSTGSVTMVNAVAGRFHAGDFTIDTGLVLASFISSTGRFEVLPFPIPWIDFSWAFGP